MAFPVYQVDQQPTHASLHPIILDWRLSDLDRRTIKNSAIEVDKELARPNLARVQVDEKLINDEEDTEIGGHCHHMGTTRMSRDPKFGLVDGDCKIHGIKNLNLGGGSEFSIGGAINPMFTIVQVSLWLVEHLYSRLG